MHTQQAPSFGDLPLFQGVTDKTSVHGLCEPERRAPYFVKSVVEEAGLGRFVYLRGSSGRRYVFSAIRPEQVGLYEHAVFAFGGVNGSPVELTSDSARLGGRDAQMEPDNTRESPIFVHLLSDSDGSSVDVITDLSNAVQ